MSLTQLLHWTALPLPGPPQHTWLFLHADALCAPSFVLSTKEEPVWRQILLLW